MKSSVLKIYNVIAGRQLHIMYTYTRIIDDHVHEHFDY